ncbi:MAG TPA: DUF6491 family protein [Rhodanobacteraceae bacterium]|jgi:hypothetical protein|nr:DUF6491 family protein [Rhodanobacteraceae bacterium]
MKPRLSLTACGLLLLAACAANPAAQQRQQDQAADYRAAAGAPVGSFNYLSSLYSWEPLDDHTLVVYTRPTQAWLLTVTPCPDLQTTFSIGVTQHVSQVSTGIDSILTSRGQYPCRIQQIRPIDMAKLHAAQTGRRRIDAMPRAGAAPSGT